MNTSMEERLYKWNAEETKKYIVHDVFLVLYFIVGFVGNLCVIIVYGLRMRNTSESRYFIPILALADFFACTLRVPFDLWKNMLPVNFQDIVGCQIVWFLVNVFTFGSIFLLAMMTFQRYMKVCWPTKQQLSLKFRRTAVVVIGLLSVSFSAPFIIWNEKLPISNITEYFNTTGYICGANVIKIDQNSNSFISFITFVSTVLVFVMFELITLNSFIARTIYRHLKQKKTRQEKATIYLQKTSQPSSSGTTVTEANSTDVSLDNQPSQTTTKQTAKPEVTLDPPEKRKTDNVSSRRFSYMFIFIGLAFVVSYIPQIFLLFSLVHDRRFWVNVSQSKTQTFVFKFLDQIVAVNNIVNPYVYGYFDVKFKREVKSLLSCTHR